MSCLLEIPGGIITTGLPASLGGLAIFIRVNNPTLNRITGKFNLPNIWDRVLLKTPGLNLKRHVQAVGQVNSNNFNIPLTLSICI